MLKTFKADLHIHTCLSPCADLDMSPSAIVRQAAKSSIDIIAITDHNSAENAAAAMEAAKDFGITVLAGMEITSREEVHILALFDSPAPALKLQDIIYEHLMPGVNDEELFGEQVVVNAQDEVLAFNPRLLIGATDLDVYALANYISGLSGISIASHVDREAFSLISQLGFIPDELNLNALEVSPKFDRNRPGRLGNTGYTLIASSDAHYIADIGKRTTTFHMDKPSTSDIAQALKGLNGKTAEWQ